MTPGRTGVAGDGGRHLVDVKLAAAWVLAVPAVAAQACYARVWAVMSSAAVVLLVLRGARTVLARSRQPGPAGARPVVRRAGAAAAAVVVAALMPSVEIAGNLRGACEPVARVTRISCQGQATIGGVAVVTAGLWIPVPPVMWAWAALAVIAAGIAVPRLADLGRGRTPHAAEVITAYQGMAVLVIVAVIECALAPWTIIARGIRNAVWLHADGTRAPARAGLG